MMTPRTLVPVALMAGVMSVQANLLTIDAVIGGVPTGVSYLDFNDLPVNTPGVLTATGNGGAVQVTIRGNAKAVTGARSGEYAAPYLSNNQGAAFDGHPDGVDTSVYLSTGSTSGGGSIRFDFATEQRYLGLLWGSVDRYNKLAFYDRFNNLLGLLTGADVLASAAGDQGRMGTAYVNILSDQPFQHVIATSDGFAFEFDNLAYNERPVSAATVPDAGYSLLLLGVGVVGVGWWRRAIR